MDRQAGTPLDIHRYRVTLTVAQSHVSRKRFITIANLKEKQFRACAHSNQVNPAEIKYLSSKTAGVRLLKDFTTGERFHHRRRTKMRGEKQEMEIRLRDGEGK